MISANTLAFSSSVKLATSATLNFVAGASAEYLSDSLPCSRTNWLPIERLPTESPATIARLTWFRELYSRSALTSASLLITVAGSVSVAVVRLLIFVCSAVPQVSCKIFVIIVALFEPCLTAVVLIFPLLSVNLVVKRSLSPA